MAFPNTKSVAYFNPKSQLVFLNEVSADEIEGAFRAKDFARLRHDISTIYHEITHWADTVGTIWGNDYLKAVYRAYDVLPRTKSPGAEADFHRFIDLHDLDRKLSFSDYYRTVRSDARPHSLNDPWRIAFSSGVEFNTSGRADEAKPIIFVRFADRISEEQIVRQPISVAALLETTATWSELSTQYLTIGALPNDERMVENVFITREYGDRLYTPELTLYSAPVHLLAHYTGSKDAVGAYHLGALVALVCLNLVPSHFRRMKIPRGLEAWGRRVGAFVRGESRPFAFKCICMNAPGIAKSNSPIEWLNAALAASNLPSYDEILGYAASRLKEDGEFCQDVEMAGRQKYLRELGADWLNWRQSNADPALDYRHLGDDSLMTPFIFDRDGTPFRILGSKFDATRFDPVDMYDREARLHTEILNFRRACR